MRNNRVISTLRGTGIAKRTPEYIQKNGDSRRRYCTRQREICRFCYIESWQHGKFVAHSGLIVHPDYRNLGLAKK
jgi:ribosomal protein S18 acetylase RimI-like enzyme